MGLHGSGSLGLGPFGFAQTTYDTHTLGGGGGDHNKQTNKILEKDMKHRIHDMSKVLFIYLFICCQVKL